MMFATSNQANVFVIHDSMGNNVNGAKMVTSPIQNVTVSVFYVSQLIELRHLYEVRTLT